MNLSPLVPVKRNDKRILVEEWQTLPEFELAKLIAQNNGGNLGVRLDHYAVVDPDEASGEAWANDLDRKGILTPTVSWKTARGFTKRLYRRPEQWPFDSQAVKLNSMKVELRSGNGVQDLIPPSIIDGNQYIWLPNKSPQDLEPAPLPEEILQFFIKHSSSSFSFKHLKTTSTKYSTTCAKTVDFGKGARDNTLFHIAYALFRGGLCYEDVLVITERLASTCEPEFSQKDAEKKVESAQKRYMGKERNLADEVRNWVLVTQSNFKVTECYAELKLVTGSNEQKAAKQVMYRLQEEGVIVSTGQRGWYRKAQGDVEKIDYMSVDPNSYLRIEWPFRFHQLVKMFPKSLAVISGSTNAGKSSFLMELCRMNMYRKDLKIRYISSETDKYELREKYDYYANDTSDLHVPLEDWDKKLDIIYRTESFIDVIKPNWINIIDHYKADGEFYEIGKELQAIHKKLKNGIAILALQKNPNTKVGYGGHQTEHLARFVLDLDPGKITIKKAKNLMPGINKGADGTVIKFKLAQGYKWLPQDIEKMFWWWNYESKEVSW